MLLVMATYPRTHRTNSELIVRWIDAYDLSGCEPEDEVLKCLEAVRASESNARVSFARLLFGHPQASKDSRIIEQFSGAQIGTVFGTASP
jgi:hypothetical protein